MRDCSDDEDDDDDLLWGSEQRQSRGGSGVRTDCQRGDSDEVEEGQYTYLSRTRSP